MTDSLKRTPLYSKIRNYIIEHIQLQKWRANDRLPTEAELAEQFCVSKFTIKNAMSSLVKEGLIYRIQGKGSFVSPSVAGEVHSSQNTDALKLVALLMPSIQNSLSANLAAGVEEQLAAHGYHVIYRSTRNKQELEQQMLRECIQLGVRGVIIFPVDGESYSEDILQLTLNKFPVVVIDRYLRGVDTNCVCSDNVQGAFDATSYLIESGHTNIAFFGIHRRTISSLEDRLNGYEKALTKHRIPIDYHRCLYKLTEEQIKWLEEQPDRSIAVQQLIRLYLEQHPDVTAVFAATTEIGIAAIETAIELGIRVPERLSVIMFDDYIHSSISRIPPSCVVQPEKQIGVEAARLLVSVIANPLQERRKITLPTKLVLRKSTCNRHV